MPTYRVLCKDLARGRDTPLQFEAATPEAARQACEQNGFTVIAIEEVPAFLVTPPPARSEPDLKELVSRIADSGIIRSPIWTIAIGVMLGTLAAALVVTFCGFALGGRFRP